MRLNIMVEGIPNTATGELIKEFQKQLKEYGIATVAPDPLVIEPQKLIQITHGLVNQETEYNTQRFHGVTFYNRWLVSYMASTRFTTVTEDGGALVSALNRLYPGLVELGVAEPDVIIHVKPATRKAYRDRFEDDPEVLKKDIDFWWTDADPAIGSALVRVNHWTRHTPLVLTVSDGVAPQKAVKTLLNQLPETLWTNYTQTAASGDTELTDHERFLGLQTRTFKMSKALLNQLDEAAEAQQQTPEAYLAKVLKQHFIFNS